MDVAELYRELDAEIERRGLRCRGCGECCCFDRVDHILYASGLERQYLSLQAPPENHSDEEIPLIERGLRCPYQVAGKCFAREGRVLGCRLHFCEGLEFSDEEELSETWHRRLKELHDRLGVDWDYRPLLPLDGVS